MLKTITVSAIAALLVSTSASADEYNWSGFYIGAHGGWATGGWDGRLATTAGNPPPDDAGFSDPTRTIDGDGYVGGGQLGYNLQFGSLVAGVEADLSWTDLGGNETFATDKLGPPIWEKAHDLSLERFGTARVRLGYAIGRFLPYVTGGIAWGKTSADLGVAYIQNGTDYKGTSYASTSETHTGWAAGAGLEWMMRDNWTVKAEWLHIDLGEEDYHYKGETYFDTPFETDSFPADLTFDVFRVGVNYKFGN